MLVKPIKIGRLFLPDGSCPFSQWMESLADLKSRAVLDARLTRVRRGNLGPCRSIGQGLYELKINYGPGFRIYFYWDRPQEMVLVSGGTKRGQNRDIEKAKAIWRQAKDES